MVYESQTVSKRLSELFTLSFSLTVVNERKIKDFLTKKNLIHHETRSVSTALIVLNHVGPFFGRHM